MHARRRQKIVGGHALRIEAPAPKAGRLFGRTSALVVMRDLPLQAKPLTVPLSCLLSRPNAVSSAIRTMVAGDERFAFAGTAPAYWAIGVLAGAALENSPRPSRSRPGRPTQASRRNRRGLRPSPSRCPRSEARSILAPRELEPSTVSALRALRHQRSSGTHRRQTARSCVEGRETPVIAVRERDGACAGILSTSGTGEHARLRVDTGKNDAFSPGTSARAKRGRRRAQVGQQARDEQRAGGAFGKQRDRPRLDQKASSTRPSGVSLELTPG